MKVTTLILSYVPLQDYANAKPAQVRNDKYFKELIGQFDLGEVVYGTKKEDTDIHNPIITIVSSSYQAQELARHNNASFVFCMEGPYWVFSRKAEVETRKQKQFEILESIAGMVKRLSEDDNEEVVRRVATWGYSEIYKGIQMAIIGEDKDLAKRAWELLNEGKGDFVWMRANLIVDCWMAADAKGKEELLTMAMKDYIDYFLAVELPVFTDEEGIQYRQYEFIIPTGEPSGYIRRIPIATPEMEKYGYQNLLDKYETPNGAQMLLEVGQAKSKLKEYTDGECEKIYKLLKAWKKDPTKTHKELNVVFSNGLSSDEPLALPEVESFKKTLKAWGEEKYKELFS